MSTCVLGSDQRPEPLPVLVVHPAVGADERQSPAGAEYRQALFKKADVEVGPASHGGALGPVGLADLGWNVFEPDIGRVADHEVGLPGPVESRVQQEVSLANPLRTEACSDIGWLH